MYNLPISYGYQVTRCRQWQVSLFRRTVCMSLNIMLDSPAFAFPPLYTLTLSQIQFKIFVIGNPHTFRQTWVLLLIGTRFYGSTASSSSCPSVISAPACRACFLWASKFNYTSQKIAERRVQTDTWMLLR